MNTRRTAALALGVLLLAGCNSYGEKLQAERLRVTAESCASDGWSPLLADGGQTVRIVTDTGDDAAQYVGLLCVFDALEMSEALRSQLDSTTAVAGQRSAIENGLRWTWTYSGASGLDMVIQVAS